MSVIIKVGRFPLNLRKLLEKLKNFLEKVLYSRTPDVFFLLIKVYTGIKKINVQPINSLRIRNYTIILNFKPNYLYTF